MTVKKQHVTKRRHVTLSFSLTYLDAGESVTTDEITLTEPGLRHFDVHNAMLAYVVRGAFQEAVRKVEELGPDGARRFGEEQARVTVHRESYEGREIADAMKGALGPEQYREFIEYGRRVLTNNPDLARLGETGPALSADMWRQISDKGGDAAIEDIVGSFADFARPRRLHLAPR